MKTTPVRTWFDATTQKNLKNPTFARVYQETKDELEKRPRFVPKGTLCGYPAKTGMGYVTRRAKEDSFRIPIPDGGVVVIPVSELLALIPRPKRGVRARR